MANYTDTDRLNFIEQDVADEPLCIHNLAAGEKVPCRGLGLKPTGRTLRQALDQIMSANGVKPSALSEREEPQWTPTYRGDNTWVCAAPPCWLLIDDTLNPEREPWARYWDGTGVAINCTSYRIIGYYPTPLPPKVPQREEIK